MRTQRPRNVTCVPLSTPARERDHQLARLALGGASRAWDLLYEKAIRSVPAAVRRANFQHFFSDWDYRDITDEALARCYDHLERYRGLSQFQWWVLGYAKNILRNRIQRQLTHRRNQSLLERAAEQHALCQTRSGSCSGWNGISSCGRPSISCRPRIRPSSASGSFFRPPTPPWQNPPS